MSLRKYNIEDDTWQDIKIWELAVTIIVALGLAAMVGFGIYVLITWVADIASSGPN